VKARNSVLAKSLTTGLFFLALIALWLTLSNSTAVPEYVLPSPGRVLTTLLEDKSILWSHAEETLKEWAVGLGLSVILALMLSWLAFASSKFSAFLQRILVVSQSVPYLTIAPLLLLWLGLGAAPKIVLILLTCTFPVAQLTLSGLISAQKEFAILATVLRLEKQRALRLIYVPAALPDFFEGVKISVTYAFVSSVMAELIGSEAGLGVYLSRAQSAYRTDRVMAAVLLIVLFSLLCTWCVELISKKVLFWRINQSV